MTQTIENPDVLCKDVLVSVVVITYQHVRFIEECLQNIVNQDTDFNFEILIGEDGSTDGTKEKCLSFAKRHQDKVRLFLRDKHDKHIINGRITERKNLVETILSARGKYIAFCEGDDYWCNPLKLRKQIAGMLESEATYSYHDVRLYYQSKKAFSEKAFIGQRGFEHFTTKSLSLWDIYFHSVIHLSALVMLKPLTIPDFFWRLPYGDIGLIALAVNSGRGYYLGEASSVYRMHSAGWSATYGFSMRERIISAFEIDKYYGKRHAHELLEKSIALISETIQIDSNDYKSGRIYTKVPFKVLLYNIRHSLFQKLKRWNMK